MRTLEVRIPRAGGTVLARCYEPSLHSEHARPLVWIHGGAFSGGGLDMQESDAVAQSLCRFGHRVLTVDYRRIPPWSPLRDAPPGPLPGIRHPLPREDVRIALAWARRRWGSWTALGGASAGACLALSAALEEARRDAAPSLMLMAYGIYHAELPEPGAALRRRLRGVHGIGQFTPAVVRRMTTAYAGSAEELARPGVLPGGTDLRRAPRLHLLDADRDALAASGEALARQAEAEGVLGERYVQPGTRHGFLGRPRTAGFRDGVAFLASRLLV